jgi:hypothetical protein
MSQVISSSLATKQQEINRYIVLVPARNVDPLDIGRQVRDLCKQRVHHVLFLSVVREVNDHLHMLYLMNKLFSTTHDNLLSVETDVEVGIPWLQAIRAVYRPGDSFVCYQEHWVPWHLFWEKPIHEILVTDFKRPVQFLSQNGRH